MWEELQAHGVDLAELLMCVAVGMFLVKTVHLEGVGAMHSMRLSSTGQGP